MLTRVLKFEKSKIQRWIILNRVQGNRSLAHVLLLFLSFPYIRQERMERMVSFWTNPKTPTMAIFGGIRYE